MSDASPPASPALSVPEDLPPIPSHLPEIGRLAAWSVSSHKYGFGVDNLRDGNENTFWQSEGPQPHTIDIAFPKRVFISVRLPDGHCSLQYVCLLTSHPRDDSYTPSRISVRAGTSVHDLQEVRFEQYDKPDGWIVIPLRPLDGDRQSYLAGAPIPAYHLRIVIVANHLNGKDTHVRGVKVFGPDESEKSGEADLPTDGFPTGRELLNLGHDGTSLWTSSSFRMQAGIR